MKLPPSAILIGAVVMILCIASTGSSSSASDPYIWNSADIESFWRDISRKPLNMRMGNQNERCLEDCLTRLVPDASSSYDTVPCSSFWDTIASWKLDGILNPNISVTICNTVNEVCRESSSARGFAYTSPESCLSNGAVSKSSLFFVAKRSEDTERPDGRLGHTWNPDPMVDIAFINVNTSAFERKDPTFSPDALQNGLFDYHQRFALDHIPLPVCSEEEYEETTPHAISKRFPVIDRDNKHRHSKHKYEYITDNENVINILGEHLDECFASSHPGNSVQYWRDCQAWTHDFTAQPTIIECEYAKSESDRTGASQGCLNVVTNGSYVQASVVPREDKKLHVYFTVEDTHKVLHECGNITSSINPAASKGTCIRTNVVQPDRSFQGKQLLTEWSHDYRKNAQFTMRPISRGDTNHTDACGTRITVKRDDGYSRLKRRNRAPRKADAPTDVVTKVADAALAGFSTLELQLLRLVQPVIESFPKILESTASNFTTTRHKVDCVRFTSVKSAKSSHIYEGLGRDDILDITKIAVSDIENPKDRDMVGIGLRKVDKYRYVMENEVQQFKLNNGTQGFMLVFKSKNREDGSFNLAFSFLTSSVGYAEDETIVEKFHSILGGLVSWNSYLVEHSSHLMKPAELALLQQYWGYLCARGIAEEIGYVPQAMPDLRALGCSNDS
ncbi:hypothetical protein BGZ72_003653 [Mortierella alpina]|nr:hypothetical protein BGZ72_003653 [Mortierella alpina]